MCLVNTCRCSWPILIKPSTAFLDPVRIHGHRTIESVLARLYRIPQWCLRLNFLELVDKVVRGFDGHLFITLATRAGFVLFSTDRLTSESSLPWIIQHAGALLVVSRLSIACTPCPSPKNSRYRPACTVAQMNNHSSQGCVSVLTAPFFMSFR